MTPSLAHDRLNQAFVCGLAVAPLFLLLIFFGVPIRLVGGLVLIVLVLFHVLLSLAANAGGRNWILFGLMPLVLPLFGGLIAANILLRAQRKEPPTSTKRQAPTAIVTAVCLVVFWVTYAAPAVITNFSVWDSPFSIFFAIATTCLFFAPVVDLVSAVTSLISGGRGLGVFISLLIGVAGLLTSIFWVALVTGGP